MRGQVDASLTARLLRHGWRLAEDAGELVLLGNGSPAAFTSEASLRAWLDKQEVGKAMQHDMLNQIVTGDARELAEQIPDNSVDLIFTDPVYENIDDYRWLAETATRVLKSDRACLVWCSNRGQFEVKAVMEKHLTFVLPLIYTKIAKAHRAFGFKTFLWSTPCLWFHNGKHAHEWLVDTVVEHSNAIISTSTPPTDSYKWHKNPEAYVSWLKAFTKPGDTVWDPFCGSGSLPLCCIELGRNFIASEILPDVAARARERVEQLKSQPRLPDIDVQQDSFAMLDEHVAGMAETKKVA